MKTRRIAFAVGVLVLVFAWLLTSARQPPERISFSKSQPAGKGQLPLTVKTAFDVTNSAPRAVFLQVVAIERHRESGWITDTQALPANTFRTLGKVKAGGIAHLSFELPQDSAPSRLCVSVAPDATVLQTARFALLRGWETIRGRAHYRQFWVNNLAVPSYRIMTPEIP